MEVKDGERIRLVNALLDDLNKLKNLYLGCEAANLRQEVHSERPYSLENPTHFTLNQ